MKRKPSTKSVGVFICTRPAANVAIQAKTWMPLGIATAMLAAEKNASDSCGMPVANM